LLPGRNASKFSWLVDIALSDPVTSDDSAVDRHLFEYCDRKDLQQPVGQAALHLQLHVLNDTLERLHLLPNDLTLAQYPDRQGLGGASTPYELPPPRLAHVRDDSPT
jgi:hypothetical protein